MIALFITAAVVFALVILLKKNRKENKESVDVIVVKPDIESKEQASETGNDVYVVKVDSLFPDSYTAIDFETATADGMACQLGLVQVDEGKIVRERVFLIKPPENRYDLWNTRVHGISADKTEGSATFCELWPEILPFFEGRHIVAHNMSFDESVLMKNLDFYGLPEPHVLSYECTCVPFGSVSLYSAACYFGINLGHHHDALADARACALLVQEYRKHFGEVLMIPKLKEKDRRVVDKKNKGWAENLDSIPDNYFKGKTIVITGVLEGCSRDEMAERLKGLGARVTGSVSKKTSIVVVGDSAGPSKLERVRELISAGSDIEVITEDELLMKLQ